MSSSSPKNLLITGAAGFIGSAFVGQRVAAGDNVIVLDALTYAGHRANLEWIEGPGNWELIVGDITDGELVSTLLRKHNINALLNFAAESHVDNSIKSPATFIETNIRGTYTLLEAARNYRDETNNQDFRYLQVSTDEVYGSLGETGKFSETTRYEPSSPYSASKAAADHLVRAWHHTYGLNTITTNCSNNYGPRQFTEKLIPLMITNAVAGKHLPIYGDGKNVRDWIHVEDHSRGIYLALTKGRAGETYCFGGNAERNNNTIVNSICDILDNIQPKSDGTSYKTQITYVEDRLGHDFRYAIDDSKAENELGFTREFNFENGLKNTIEWYLTNNQWLEAINKEQAA